MYNPGEFKGFCLKICYLRPLSNLFMNVMQLPGRIYYWGQRAKSTDRDKLTANKLTANQQFRRSDFVTDFVVVISSLSEGSGKMSLGIVKYF